MIDGNDPATELTKRDYIAIQIMAAKFGTDFAVTDIKAVAQSSIKAADILIEELKKSQE